jgi:dTDP-glucose 4,6-dehydratase
VGKESILVTGGAGFIGSEFVRQTVFQDRFSKVYIVDSLTYASDLNRINTEIVSGKVELIHCDINEVDKYQLALKTVSKIIHFAAESHVDRSIADGTPFISTNIMGTYRLLDSVRKNGNQPTLIVSTDEVYGSVLEGESREDSQFNPSSAYSASKASSDLIALSQIKTFSQNLVITRACNNYGPMQHREKFIPNSIASLIEGKNITLYGNGENVREWMHVSDHASALIQIMDNWKPGEIYNIGSGVRLSNFEVSERILTLLSLNEDRIKFVPDRAGHDFRYALNSTKIRKQIGWQPQIDFQAGLQALINEAATGSISTGHKK